MNYKLYYVNMAIYYNEYYTPHKSVICPIICDEKYENTKKKIISLLKDYSYKRALNITEGNFIRKESSGFFSSDPYNPNTKFIEGEYLIYVNENGEEDYPYVYIDILEATLPMIKYDKSENIKETLSKEERKKVFMTIHGNEEFYEEIKKSSLKLKDCCYALSYLYNLTWDMEEQDTTFGGYDAITKNLKGMLMDVANLMTDNNKIAPFISRVREHYKYCYEEEWEEGMTYSTHTDKERVKELIKNTKTSLLRYDRAGLFEDYDDNYYSVSSFLAIVPIVSYNNGEEKCGEK